MDSSKQWCGTDNFDKEIAKFWGAIGAYGPVKMSLFFYKVFKSGQLFAVV